MDASGLRHAVALYVVAHDTSLSVSVLLQILLVESESSGIWRRSGGGRLWWRRLLLEPHSGVLPFSYRPWRGLDGHDALFRPSVRHRSSHKRPRRRQTLLREYVVDVCRAAIPDEDAFLPPRAHVAVWVARGAFRRQLVEDNLAVPDQHLVERSALDSRPWREAVVLAGARVEDHAGMLQEPRDNCMTCWDIVVYPCLQAQFQCAEQATHQHNSHLRAAVRLRLVLRRLLLRHVLAVLVGAPDLSEDLEK